MADCFDCGIKLGWSSSKIDGKTMKSVQQRVNFSDDVLDRMNDKDVLCDDCSFKLMMRHAVELYNHDKNTLSEKEWEDTLKMPHTKAIFQEAERILAEQHPTSTASTNSIFPTSNTTPTIQNTRNTSNDMTMPQGEPAKEKLAVISGNTIQRENQKGHEMTKQQIENPVKTDGQLQTRFEEFAKTHEIIDWHITQEGGSANWRMFIRYKS
jgi:hypothetical protein